VVQWPRHGELAFISDRSGFDPLIFALPAQSPKLQPFKGRASAGGGFQAIEIDGEHYWDGGYMGNPAIFPLIYNGHSKDVIIVHVNPLERVDLPTTAPQILNRINEISFNSSLLRELRAIAFVTQLIDAHVLDKKQFHRMLIHSIRADEEMVRLGISSKLNPDWNFLCHLRDIGRATTAAWLECNYDQVNRSSTIDIHETYL
jgi:NTE family protein